MNGNRLKKILEILDKTKRWGEEWEKEEGFRKKKSGHILVFDWGGGTLDVSILKITSLVNLLMV